jgi:hypothetical protein
MLLDSASVENSESNVLIVISHQNSIPHEATEGPHRGTFEYEDYLMIAAYRVVVRCSRCSDQRWSPSLQEHHLGCGQVHRPTTTRTCRSRRGSPLESLPDAELALELALRLLHPTQPDSADGLESTIVETSCPQQRPARAPSRARCGRPVC